MHGNRIGACGHPVRHDDRRRTHEDSMSEHDRLMLETNSRLLASYAGEPFSIREASMSERTELRKGRLIHPLSACCFPAGTRIETVYAFGAVGDDRERSKRHYCPDGSGEVWFALVGDEWQYCDRPPSQHDDPTLS